MESNEPWFSEDELDHLRDDELCTLEAAIGIIKDIYRRRSGEKSQ